MESVLHNSGASRASPRGWSPAVVIAVTVSLVLWGAAFVGNRVVLKELPPGELALARYLIASLVMLLLTWWIRPVRPRRADMPRLLATGALGIALYNLTVNYGLQTVGAGAASFIVNTAPIFTALMAMLLLRERLGWSGWLGLGISMTGVGLIAVGEVPINGHGLVSWGAVSELLAALLWAAFPIVQKPLLPRYGAIGLVGYAIWIGTLMLLPFAPGLITHAPSLSATAWSMLFFLGVFPGACAYITWSFALSRLPVTQATPFLYVVPVIALLMAWLWSGETAHPLSLLGGTVAIIGVAVHRFLGHAAGTKQ